MAAGEERRALERAITAWRRVTFGERQSIRRPQQPLAAARQGEEAPGEAETPSE